MSTICAIATSMGGAIGIVRVSGDAAIAIVDSIFRGRKPLIEAKSHTLHHGTIVDDERATTIDDVLVSVFRAPHSYTGEESVELSCHGSPYVLGEVCRLLIKAGCRQAEPGEFTRRAFLNGKLDLAQAEAVADLIATRTEAQHRMAMGQLRGTFSRYIDSLHERLLRLTSLMELELDFADHEEIEFADRSQLIALCREVGQMVERLRASFATGNAIKEGVRVAIVGPTNAGKSTLLNAILHDERAIVSHIHGTTRDTIEDTFVWQGITFRFIDTAGLRTTHDVVEQIGIDRTHQAIKTAHIVLFVVDAQTATTDIQQLLPTIETCSCPHIVLCNKCDIATDALQQLDGVGRVLNISALNGIGLDTLERQVCDIARQHLHLDSTEPIVNNLRHYQALSAAREALERVASALIDATPCDLITPDLRHALYHLATITHRAITPDDVLHSIFSEFCIGK